MFNLIRLHYCANKILHRNGLDALKVYRINLLIKLTTASFMLFERIEIERI